METFEKWQFPKVIKVTLFRDNSIDMTPVHDYRLLKVGGVFPLCCLLSIFFHSNSIKQLTYYYCIQLFHQWRERYGQLNYH